MNDFLESLTPRERDVYELSCKGFMNKQIAAELNTSQRTVEIHRLNIGWKGRKHGLRWGRCMVKIPETRECPLLISLTADAYDEFSLGIKNEYLCRYSSRWNESACRVGREVVIRIRGRGGRSPMTGRIGAFKKQHGSTFGSTYKASILDVYGTLEVEIACIRIDDIKPEGKAGNT